jgi:hypothetical protein
MFTFPENLSSKNFTREMRSAGGLLRRGAIFDKPLADFFVGICGVDLGMHYLIQWCGKSMELA